MSFLVYHTPLIYDNAEVYYLIGEKIYNQLQNLNYDEQLKNGGAYKDGVYHNISYRYLFWMLIKGVSYLTLVLDDGVKYIRSSHIPNFEWDRLWSPTELLVATLGLVAVVGCFTLSISSGVAVLTSTVSTTASSQQQQETPTGNSLPVLNITDYERIRVSNRSYIRDIRSTWEDNQEIETYCLDVSKDKDIINYDKKIDELVCGGEFDHYNQRRYNQLFVRSVAEESPGVYRKTVTIPDNSVFGGIYDYQPKYKAYIKRTWEGQEYREL